MPIFYLILTILNNHVVVVDGISANAYHCSCCQGKQGHVMSDEVNTTVDELLTRHGMLLLAKTKAHLNLFIFRCRKRHHKSTGRLQ